MALSEASQQPGLNNLKRKTTTRPPSPALFTPRPVCHTHTCMWILVSNCVLWTTFSALVWCQFWLSCLRKLHTSYGTPHTATWPQRQRQHHLANMKHAHTHMATRPQCYKTTNTQPAMTTGNGTRPFYNTTGLQDHNHWNIYMTSGWER